MRAIPAILVIALAVAAAVFVADRPGSVAIAWQGWRVDTSVGVLVAATLVAAVVAALVYSLLRRIVGGPRAWLRGRRERRRRAGYRALTQGMVAVAAGDAQEAQKLARKADALLAEPPLTLLLSAQAAQLDGDEQAAQRYFTVMLERPETEFLGLRGLIMQALRAGDEATALALTMRAKALRPRTPWVLANQIELQARAGQWPAAEATLAEAARRKAVPAPEGRHRQAALLLAQAAEVEARGRGGEAMRLTGKAQALEPGFAPAAAAYAEMLRVRGQGRRARRALETAWQLAPHPALAEAYRALFADETPLVRLQRLERFARLNPDPVEGGIALARGALAARLWGEARRHLAAAGAEGEPETLPPRLCRLMAELEEAENGDQAAARRWLDHAAAATVADPAWACEVCAQESAQWTPLCARCHSFDALVWRRDRSLLPMRAIAPLTPAQPLIDAAPGARRWLPALFERGGRGAA